MTTANYPLWSEHDIIFSSDEDYSILWGKFMGNVQKCLGIRYRYFPYKQVENSHVPTYLVLPDMFTQTVFEKILSRAIIDGHDKSSIDKITNAMTEWETYSSHPVP